MFLPSQERNIVLPEMKREINLNFRMKASLAKGIFRAKAKNPNVPHALGPFGI
jgi:hypothetical protein